LLPRSGEENKRKEEGVGAPHEPDGKMEPDTQEGQEGQG